MNPIKEIFTGGACNADEMTRGRGAQNPLTNFMQQLITGRGQVRQGMEGFYPEEQMMQHPAMIQRQMEDAWGAGREEHMHKMAMEEQMMRDMWEAEKLRLQEMNRQRMIAQHQAWQDARVQQQQQKIEGHAQDWIQNYTEQYQQEQMEKAFDQEETEFMDKQARDEVVKEAAGDMMDTMMNDPDPKFKNSQFLSFLSKLKTGEYSIEGKELVIDPTKAVAEPPKFESEEFKTDFNPELTKAWDQAQEEYDEETKNDDPFQHLYNEAWKLAQEGKTDESHKIMEQLDEEYKKVLEQMEKANLGGDEDIMGDVWAKAQDIEEHSLYRDIGPYEFTAGNPFTSDPNPLEKALVFISNGHTVNAILALEAHLQKNPADSQNWRVLGRLHQENDEDPKAVPCLLEASKIDPDHLDTQLSLGVSCTNTLDEMRGMTHLNRWLHLKYPMLNINPQIIPPEKLDGKVTTEEVKMYNQQLVDQFMRAKQLDPSDPGLHSALAVLFFIQRNYDASVDCFRQALAFDKLNYSLWNKLGATLAHLGRTPEAMEAYHRALDLKPNYVRVWVNLGIAHAFNGDYEEAARFYLNALSFNPNAMHLWSYLNSTFVSMERFDLIPKIARHDVRVFADEFDILTLDQLPIPEMAYNKAHMQYVVQQEAGDWAHEFNGGMPPQEAAPPS